MFDSWITALSADGFGGQSLLSAWCHGITFEQVGKYSVLDVPPSEAGTWPRTGTNTAKLLCTYLGTSRRILAMYLPRYL